MSKMFLYIHLNSYQIDAHSKDIGKLNIRIGELEADSAVKEEYIAALKKEI
jgi:hypothetical protein